MSSKDKRDLAMLEDAGDGKYDEMRVLPHVQGALAPCTCASFGNFGFGVPPKAFALHTVFEMHITVRIAAIARPFRPSPLLLRVNNRANSPALPAQ